MHEITEGSDAPEIALPRDGGETVRLADFLGRKLVLYFYPKDDTSGCTTEAKDFSALASEFAARDTVVIGISKDSVQSHDKFLAKHALNVMLLSDAEGDVAERYGVWVEKSMYGRKYMGIERSTFLIDAEGMVAQVWRKVKVPGHAAAVLAAVEAA